MRWGTKFGVAAGVCVLLLSGLTATSSAATDASAQAYACYVKTRAGTGKYYAGYYSGESVTPRFVVGDGRGP
ncbi:hypothetical protein [Streptomyces sp. RFCAC02]|uniref:hypothetical protein n=1 Tax=Streptomyces sp. RFCAC02 TaxID=2499143 RepID=UPI0010214CC0|nr:hypothetical protein [Streptomyces sp. RFCAC02]